MIPAERGGISELKEEIVGLLPNLRAFARTLVSDPSAADDLVQESITKALANLDRFQIGTNLQAWLFTILRNTFYSGIRKRRREVEDADGEYANRVVSAPTQLAKLDSRDFRRALANLAFEQREALILVGPAGFSYEEAAEICNCAVGTIKSRVNRGRARLTQIMGHDEERPAAAGAEATATPSSSTAP